ncbi:MAG: hypothetical protein H6Q99_1796 [Proteobacteria bacterium]|nr:hypothetical protein [Pseudomonadota bacterium]
MDRMTYWANISSIGAFVVTLIGAAVGVYGYLEYRCKWRQKKMKLECYLLESKKNAGVGDQGQKTVLHLVRHLGLTEDEILKISFESKHIERRTGQDDHGRADILYFVYAN